MQKKLNNYAVLWDLDGTIVDTSEPHFISWRDTLDEIGINYSRDDFRTVFGVNNAGGLKLLYGDRISPELRRALGEKKELIFLELIRKGLEPLPGVLEWLEKLQNWGVKQAIASSAPMGNIDALVDGLGIRQYFEAIVSGAELLPKPNPDVFLKAASELGVPAERCMVFEDAVAGVNGALNAGMRCVALQTSNSAEGLQAANLLLKDLTDLSEEMFLRLIED